MIGYLFLSIALICGATKGYCGKKTGSITSNTQSAIYLNIFRMSICFWVSGLLILVSKDVSYLKFDIQILLIAALSGISTSIFVVSWLLLVKKCAYMMIEIFLLLGTLIPIISGYFLYSEDVLFEQWIGLLVLFVAVVIMCSYNNSVKIKLTIKSVAMLILCGAANGFTDFSQKIYVKTFPEMPISIFSLYTYFFAAITLMVFYLFNSRKEKPIFESGSALKYVYILIMAIALFTNSYFKTKAATYLDSAQLYPLNQGASLILSMFMSSVFFKEKLTMKCITGIIIAFIGLLMMNI